MQASIHRLIKKIVWPALFSPRASFRLWLCLRLSPWLFAMATWKCWLRGYALFGSSQYAPWVLLIFHYASNMIILALGDLEMAYVEPLVSQVW